MHPKLARTASALLALLLMTGPWPTGKAAPPPADLVLRGGKVATVDPALGVVEALAITGTEIAAVGSNEAIGAYVGDGTEVVELAGRLAIPGFIEGHGHFLSLGRAKQILDLSAAEDWEAIVAMIARAVDDATPGEWIFGRGWHQDKWTHLPPDAVEGVPRNDRLSAVSPANPVLLGHASGHAAFANDAALAAAGIDGDTPDPPGGTIVRTPEGEATGLLRETAQRLVDDAAAAATEALSAAQREALLREQVRLAGEEALRHGVTAFHDAGVDFATIDFFARLEAEGALPVRLYAMIRFETNDVLATKLAPYRRVAEGNGFLTVRSIKRQLDGALGAHGAWLLEPYSDLPASTGLVLEPVAVIERTAELALQHGYQLNTHAIGTRANRETLDLYERVWARAGADGGALRWRVEHAQHLHPDDVPRFGELGVIAAVQGVHCTSDGPWLATRLGGARTERTSYRWRDLIDSGAIVANGTDVPVEPIDPLASFHASVTRVMSTGEAFHPAQAMTREEALASYTRNNAFAAFDESRTGTLTPGKLADVVVLSQDILTVPAAQIRSTRVDLTFVGGELAYAR